MRAAGMKEKRFKTRSEAGTLAMGERVVEMLLPAPKMIVLRGELGAGKTTLVKGIAAALGAADAEEGERLRIAAERCAEPAMRAVLQRIAAEEEAEAEHAAERERGEGVMEMEMERVARRAEPSRRSRRAGR